MLELGRLDAAFESFQRGQALSEKLKSRHGLASAAYNIASVRKRQGKRTRRWPASGTRWRCAKR